MKQPAVFLDRDDTVIEDRGYITTPDQVCLIPGAAGAIRRFSDSGYFVVVVSNQSGIARGLFDEAALATVHARVEELLEAEGAQLHGAYYCPYLDGPQATVDAYRRDSDLRKPRPGMLLQAARELNIDLSRSWMIGDSVSDVEAGRAAGCRTILIEPEGAMPEDGAAAPDHTVASLEEAANIVERHTDMHENRDEQTDSEPNPRDNEIVGLLSKIHDLLDRAHRQDRQLDFSVLRLFGALLQMFAIVAALWGAVSLMDGRSAVATARLSLACFFQLACITAFAIDRFR